MPKREKTGDVGGQLWVNEKNIMVLKHRDVGHSMECALKERLGKDLSGLGVKQSHTFTVKDLGEYGIWAAADWEEGFQCSHLTLRRDCS